MHFQIGKQNANPAEIFFAVYGYRDCHRSSSNRYGILTAQRQEISLIFLEIRRNNWISSCNCMLIPVFLLKTIADLVSRCSSLLHQTDSPV